MTRVQIIAELENTFFIEVLREGAADVISGRRLLPLHLGNL
jgi:hypothetical protein